MYLAQNPAPHQFGTPFAKNLRRNSERAVKLLSILGISCSSLWFSDDCCGFVRRERFFFAIRNTLSMDFSNFGAAAHCNVIYATSRMQFDSATWTSKGRSNLL